MSSDDIAIKVSNLSKRYEIYEAPRNRLKQFIFPRLQRLFGRLPKQYFREFWALRDVSFEIKKGQTVGIIGRNGSGKSTLLQMICGILTPTFGSIETNGRIAALLELGSGFNPEFTGRENVYFSASVLGLTTEETDEQFEKIIEFADIGDFVNQPVKNYSSGMFVRLAYAVIAHVGADILVVDEALAVGDVFFQQKCMRHLRAFQHGGGTVIFVSHDTAAVSNLCDRAVLLVNGKVVAEGETDATCQKYLENVYADRQPFSTAANELDNNSRSNISEAGDSNQYDADDLPENLIHISPFRKDASSFGQGGAQITDAWFADQSGARLTKLHGGDQVDFFIQVQSLQKILHPAFGFIIKDRLGQNIIAEGTDLAFRSHALQLAQGDVVQVRLSFAMPILIQGDYTINLAIAEGVGDEHIQHHWLTDAIVLHSQKSRLVHGICGVQNLKLDLMIRSGN